MRSEDDGLSAADNSPATPVCLEGSGEMCELLCATDWAKTPLGPVDSWPDSLKTATSICLNSRFPMVLWWGEDLRLIYNDAWRPSLGALKHPAIAKSGREVWAEIWHIIGPQLEGVLRTGQATWSEDMLLPMDRYGYLEETYWTYSYSPIRLETGGVGGVFTAVTETTERYVGERRLRTLRELAEQASKARTAEDACRNAGRTLSQNDLDVPFALVYLVDPTGRTATLIDRDGVSPDGVTPGGNPTAPETVRLTRDAEGIWPLAQVARTGRAAVVDRAAERFGRLPSGGWPNPPEKAVVLPVRAAGRDQVAALLVCGASAGRPLDDAYRGFFDLLAAQLGTAIDNARALEEERRKAEELAALDQAKTAFFSNVSHEFRTPLTLMLGPTDDLLSDPELSPRQREQVSLVRRNGLRLLKLVNTLLDFSRIEAGRVQAVYEPVDLARYTADLASVFRSAVERAGLTFAIDCPPVGEPAYVDRDMWEKVVLNLLSNAFKFTFSGGIAVSLRRAGGAVELRVTDTGTGIPAEELPRVFERFHRVTGARGRTHEGSGIGLALVQELARLHGGVASAESVVGRGSTFTVSVPLGRAHLPADRIGAGRSLGSTAVAAQVFVEEALRWLPDEGAATVDGDGALGDGAGYGSLARRATAGGRRERVVLADDNADMRDYVGRLLSERFDVEAVPDGEAALHAIRARRPDLVITDVMMPGLDGFGLLRAIRRDPTLESLPVVMLSARAGEEATVEGMEAGADDYLVKPFGAREFLARATAQIDRKRFERVLREAEERLAVALRNAPVMVYTTDRDLRYTWVHRPHRGVTAERLLGRRDDELLPPDVARELVQFKADVIASGSGARREITLHIGDRDETFDVTAEPLRDDGGSVVGLTVAAIDVTERKQSELAIADSERRLRAVVEATPECVKVVAPDGTLEFMNGAGLCMIEADGEPAVLGARVLDLVAPEYRAEWADRHRRVCSGERMSWQFEIVGLKGTRRWMETHAVPLTLPDGRTAQLSVTRDITERKGAEAEREALFERERAAREAAELTSRMKDEFLATLSHELRTPLNAIVGWAQLLQRRRIEEGMLAEGVATIARNAKAQAQLIEDLLDMSRIVSGKVRLNLREVRLADIAREAIETVRPAAAAKGVRLVASLDDAAPAVSGDPARLLQVAWNLLSNAVKFTSRGGTVAAAVRRAHSEVLLSVTDSGRGISPSFLPYVFERFRQADATTTRQHGGLGLGLAIVEHLVELHGGSVEAGSDGLGAGATFTVRFPVAALNPVRPGPAAEQGEKGRGTGEDPQDIYCRSLGGVRVLVVDDEPDSRSLLARVLSECKADVTQAAGADEAMDLVRSEPFDVIVSDIGMPGRDGYSLLRAVRGLPDKSGGRTPAVALTAFARPEDRQRAMAAGFQVHVAKPVDPAELVSVVANLASVSARDGSAAP